MEYVDKFFAFLTDPTVLIGAPIVIEFALRLIKSDKPLSILYGVALVARKVGEYAVKLADFLDKVVPQRLK